MPCWAEGGAGEGAGHAEPGHSDSEEALEMYRRSCRKIDKV